MAHTTGRLHAQLAELNALWIDLSPDSLRRIPLVCQEIEESTGRSDAIDKELLRRLERLAANAERRLVECLAIQSRTGAYSMHGSFELMPRVATSGWEG